MSRQISKDIRTMALRIAKLRSAEGLSQLVLANGIYASRNTIMRIEHGSSDPKASTLISLCEALRCTPNDLFPARLSEQMPKCREEKAREEKLNRLSPYQHSHCVNLFNQILDTVRNLVS